MVNWKIEKKSTREIISIVLVIVGFLIFFFTLPIFLLELAFGLLGENIYIPCLFLSLFIIFIGIILVLLATELKIRFAIASAMAFFLFFLLILISFTSLNTARKDLEFKEESKDLVTEGIISYEEYNKFEPMLTEDELIFYEQFIYSAIFVSGTIGIISLFVFTKDVLKNKNKNRSSLETS